MKSQQKKCDTAGIAAVVTAILVSSIIFVAFKCFHLFHTWSFQDVDGTNVKVCLECGEIKEIECSHSWEVQKVEDEFISYCTKCGEPAK